MEFHEDLKIDLHALDSECLRLATDFMRYAETHAKATSDVAAKKRRLTVLRAEKDSYFRDNYQELGFEKLTEKTCQSWIDTNEEVKQAEDGILDAMFIESLNRAAVEAFRHKRKMVENLVRLYESQYWAEPVLPSKAMEKLADEGTESQKEALKGSRIAKKKPLPR